MKDVGSTDAQRQHFNSIASEYSSSRESGNHQLLKKLMWSSFFKRKKVKDIKVQSVLEPMCGMAEGHQILQRFLGYEFTYKGFDYSEEMVKISRNKNPGLDIEWHDVTTYHDKTRSYDLIILLAGLHHVYSMVDKVVPKLSENLLKGGYFISFEPTHDNCVYGAIRERIYKNNDKFDAETEQGFAYADLNNVFVNSGYKKVDEIYPGLLSYILFFNPDVFPRLNIGGRWLVYILFSIDRLFWGSWIGRKLSFATLTLWQKL